jgi:hypothetical protein
MGGFGSAVVSILGSYSQLSNTVVKAKIDIEEIEGKYKLLELLRTYQKLYKVYPINCLY